MFNPKKTSIRLGGFRLLYNFNMVCKISSSYPVSESEMSFEILEWVCVVVLPQNSLIDSIVLSQRVLSVCLITHLMRTKHIITVHSEFFGISPTSYLFYIL